MDNNKRKPKTDLEVEAILAVQRAVEKAAEAAVNYLREEKKPTAERVHEIIEEILAGFDCESPEGHIVASGKKSAEPHVKGNGPIEKGQPIVIDIYPRSKKSGYFADMSRTVCIGKPPAKLRKMYNAVLGAEELAFSLVKPGLSCAELQKAADDFFLREGFETSGKGKEFRYAEGFVHGLGHGVGLEIHEAPHIGRSSEDVLQEGDVITVEPGLYYKDIGGVRIEDMVLVTKSGFRSLTNFPKIFEI